MTIPDIINGAFESLASFFMLFSCRRVYRDKKVRGVSAVSLSFFSIWSIWNLYYYPSLHQLWSFAGASAMATVNTTYVSMVLYYIWREKRCGAGKS